MGDFIAQIKILSNMLVYWAIKFVYKNAKKAKNSGFGDIFSSAYVVKYAFGRYETSSGLYLGLMDLATLLRLSSVDLASAKCRTATDSPTRREWRTVLPDGVVWHQIGVIS